MIAAKTRIFVKPMYGRALMSTAPASDASTLLINHYGNATVVTFNRPKALNALDLEMGKSLANMYKGWQNKTAPTPGVLIMKGAGGKAFCAGGDVKSVCDSIKLDEYAGTGHPNNASAAIMRTMFQMLLVVASSPVPQVSLWDGIVMGGGLGVSVFGKYKVATEKTLLAMPESAIGIFPDAGSTSWMPKLVKPGFTNYVGLTGGHLTGPDLIYAGIASHYVPSARIAELEQEIIKAATPDPVTSDKVIGEVLNKFSVKPDDEFYSKSILKINEDLIKKIFANPASVEEVMKAFKAEGDAGNGFALKTYKSLARLSPTSLKIILEGLRRGKNLSLRECMDMEFRVYIRCLAKPNFQEGVRAVLVEKDNKPKWIPSTLEEVSDETIQEYFAPQQYGLFLEK